MNEVFKDPDVKNLYQRLAISSTNDPHEDAVSFLGAVASTKESEEIISSLRCSASALAREVEDSNSIGRQMKFLLMVQFEHSKSLQMNDPFCPNDDLAEWASEILERLRVCASSQSEWKNFIRYALSERFKNSHRKTLSLIYSNIGLKRPAFLPRLSDEEGDGPEEPVAPPTQPRLPELPKPDSPFEGKSTWESAESVSHNSTNSSMRSKATYLDLDQKVLMPSAPRYSLRRKRKASYPTKRTSLPAVKQSLVADICKSKKPRQRRASISQRSVLKKCTPLCGKRMNAKNRDSSVQRGNEDSIPQHPPVTETPNPKANYPRWERARMAAAAKIKNKNVVIAESPLKPSKSDTMLGSPLRRLRRASSYLNFPINSDSQCSSQLGARAERYQRRLLEEETSLSQFSGGESNSATQPASTSASSSDLRRRSSNLMINFASPRTPFKPTLNSTISSPPVLNASKRRLTDGTTLPHGQLFETDESFSKRQKVELEGGAATQVLPSEYNEDAMFLGEDEFLRHTNTPSQTRNTQNGVETRRTSRKHTTVLSSSNAGDQIVPKAPMKSRTPVINLRGAAIRKETLKWKVQSGVGTCRTPKKRSAALSSSKNIDQSISMTPTHNRAPRIPNTDCRETSENTKGISGEFPPTVVDLLQLRTSTSNRPPLSPVGNVHDEGNSGMKTPTKSQQSTFEDRPRLKTPRKRAPLSPTGMAWNVPCCTENFERKAPRTPKKPLQSTRGDRSRLNRKRTPLSPIDNVRDIPGPTEDSRYSSFPEDRCGGTCPNKQNGRSSRLKEENLPRYEGSSGPAGNTRSTFNNFIPPYSFGKRVTPRKSLFSNISNNDDSVCFQETPNSSTDNSAADTPQKRLFHSPNKILLNAQFLQQQQKIFLETEIFIPPHHHCPS